MRGERCGASITVPASEPATEAAEGAARIDGRGAMRESLDVILKALAALHTALKQPDARSEACSHLAREGEEWAAFLGGGGSATAAVAGVLSDLEKNGASSRAGFVSSTRELTGALKAAMRSV